MAKAAVQVQGLKELSRALQQADPALRDALRDALAEGAQPALTTARQRVPRRTGRLAGSIRIRKKRTGALVGSPLVYAPIIHFGRKAVHPGGTRRPHIRKLRPVNYLISAVEDRTTAIEAAVEASLEKVLQRMFGG